MESGTWIPEKLNPIGSHHPIFRIFGGACVHACTAPQPLTKIISTRRLAFSNAKKELRYASLLVEAFAISSGAFSNRFNQGPQVNAQTQKEMQMEWRRMNTSSGGGRPKAEPTNSTFSAGKSLNSQFDARRTRRCAKHSKSGGRPALQQRKRKANWKRALHENA